MIKLDVTETAGVKEEPSLVPSMELAAAAEMDLEFDCVESALKERASVQIRDKPAESRDTGKEVTLEEVEEKAREAERQMETAKLPEDTSGWERAVIAAPNNSEVWLRYSTFHITAGEIEKARLTMDRALKTINFREEEDRLNIWKARLNLETLYGDEDTLHSQFNEAKRCNDEKKIYTCLIDIHLDSQKFTAAAGILRDAVKKYPSELEFWAQLGRCQLESNEKNKAKVTLERALQANKAKSHVQLIQKFARLEFELGDCERGKTILEQTLKLHPKRADLWGSYSDMLLKYSSIDEARRALERGIELCSKSRGKIHLIKRIITLESRNGDEETAQEWRTKLENEINKKSTNEKIE